VYRLVSETTDDVSSSEAATQDSLGRSPRNLVINDLALKARKKSLGASCIFSAGLDTRPHTEPRLRR
jgi:hypothetical protein